MLFRRFFCPNFTSAADKKEVLVRAFGLKVFKAPRVAGK